MPRDSDLLAYVASSKEVDLGLLASMFFERDPQTGKPNKNPRAAALRRLAKLDRAGLLTSHQARVRVTARGAAHVNGSVSEPCAVTMRAHHDGTLAAVEHYRRYLPRDLTFAGVVLEGGVRQQRMRGRGVAATKIGSLPDAVITLRNAAGGHRQVAFEYVSAKYTNSMIEGKLAGFRDRYDDVVFYADTAATAARVTRVLGMECRCT